MKAKDVLIAWTPSDPGTEENPTRGAVGVGPLLTPKAKDWTQGFSCTGGAAYTDRRTMTGWRQIAMVFIDYHAMVAGDGIDPMVAHEAMLEIDEFRRHMAQDIPGSQASEDRLRARRELDPSIPTGHRLKKGELARIVSDNDAERATRAVLGGSDSRPVDPDAWKDGIHPLWIERADAVLFIDGGEE